jgi:hypothetical protein
MSYIKTKLSYEDTDILKEIYDELEEITLPSSFRNKGGQGHQIRTGTVSQKGARQTSFGVTYFQGKYRKSNSTKKYPYIMPLFKKFMKSHYPSFKFKSVYVNKNTISKKHLDSKNTGESLLVGFGIYTGGKTVIYINDKPKKFQIKLNSLIFNGSEILHYSEPFKGTRYSLVFLSNCTTIKCI